MHLSILSTALLALGLAEAQIIARDDAPAVGPRIATPAPAAAVAVPARAPAPPRRHQPRQMAPPMPASTDVTCAQAAILAQGIVVNIADQQQELATATQMAQLLAQTPVNSAAWATARQSLLQFINNGIAIREMNQLIMPMGNRATAGVATVANAQLQELGLATNLTLTGSDNVAGNRQIVQTLQMDFMGGIQQNMKNMADVSPPPPLHASSPLLSPRPDG